MKMLAAGARMKRTRCVVIRGKKRLESAIPDLGIGLQYIPAQTFLDDYESMDVSDAVPRTLWKPGQRVTCLDVLPGDGKERPTRLLISVGTVIDNIAVPSAGGCVVSVRVKFDGGQNVLSFPGFHQLFFYGEYSEQLKEFCQLYGLEAQIV